MSQLTSIRLRPTDPDFLGTQAFDSGSIFYDSIKNTLVLMDGRTRGGYELLKSDLSNLPSGDINFGSASLTATAFIGNGSQLTNLPIPADLATQTYVNTAITTAFTTVKASTTQFGTVKVDGTTILIDTNGVISSVGGGGGGGVDLTAFSVAAEPTASGNGSLTYSNTTGVFTYTPPDLSTFLTSYTETDTFNSVTTRGATTGNAVTINSLLTASSLSIGTTASVTGNVTLSANLTVGGTLYTTSIINDGTGVPRWTSGSDFVIDAAGDVNVVGSKITNLATPTALTDAANKAYVDGAASAFSGGTVTGQTFFTNSTASSSSITGAVTVGGGLGVAGDIYAGGLLYSNGSPVLTSDSGGYNGGIVSGTIFVNNNTASTTPSTGALRVLGGVGIVGTLNTGPDAYFNTIRFGRGAGSGLGSNTNVGIGGGTGSDSPLSSNVSGINNIAVGFKTLSGITGASNNTAVGYNAMSARTGGNSNVAVGENALTAGSSASNTAIGAGAMGTATADTSTALGHDALKISTGSGNMALGYLSGHLLDVGSYNVIIGGNDGATIDGTSYNILISDGAGTIRISADVNGKVSIPGSNVSNSTTTGALVVAGGVGIGGAVNAGGDVKISSGTTSSSTTTGALQVTGGAGFGGNIHAAAFYGDGANLTGVVASGFGGGTVAGATNFTNNTASTSTTTGAVRVSAGGLGVAGRVSAANFNGIVVPGASVAPGANAFVRTDGSGYTYTNYINSNTGNSENPTISQFIVQNATDNFYRKASLAHVKSGLGITPIIGTPASNYGAVAIQGEKNGWSGISIRNTAGNLCGTLMMTTTAQGIYNAADNAWLLQWDQAGNFTATANVTAYSDERLKKNIQIIPNALDKVMQLDGITFERISNGERGTGLRAQQLQKVLPEAVLADEEGMLSVAYGNTVGLLIEAMKEQQAQIESLRAELAELKGK